MRLRTRAAALVGAIFVAVLAMNIAPSVGAPGGSIENSCAAVTFAVEDAGACGSQGWPDPHSADYFCFPTSNPYVSLCQNDIIGPHTHFRY